MSRPPDAAADRELKPFLEHLEDLRRTVLGAGAALLAGMLIAFPCAPRAVAILRRPLEMVRSDSTPFLKTLEVAGAFNAVMSVSFWGGLLLSSPLVVWLGLRFLWPGLTMRERRVVRQSLGVSFILFAAGVALGYCLVLPAALRIMLEMNRWMGVEPVWTLNNYLMFSMSLLTGFGLAFQLPLLLIALGRLGLVRSDSLSRYRRHAIVLLLIIAAVITPGPDVFSQLLVAVPLILLYEFCIWLVRRFERQREAADQP